MTPSDMSPDTGLNPEVFRKAAEACIRWKSCPVYVAFRELHLGEPPNMFFDFFQTDLHDLQGPEHRAIALLLFADMIESGDV